MAQYRINDNTNCLNTTTNYFNNVLNYTVADDWSQLLTWLSPLEPKLRHRDIQERRVESVGEWLPQNEEFKSWCDRSEGGNAVLFCHGDPGAGKTFISSLVVDRLCDQVGGQNAAVTCFYFNFAAQKEQTAANVLGSLLKQIVSGMERIPGEISEAFERQKNAIGGRGPQLPDIVKMLQAITLTRPTFICIDALDECAGLHRVKVLNSLKQILAESPGTRIFVTGRSHIRTEIESRLLGRVVSISIGTRKHDIIKYLRARLDDDETPEAMDETLEADILEKIPENISEMFLLASLNIESILQESTIHRRRERLGKMTDGLGLEAAYGATIERIKAQDGDKSRLGMAALMWISHAEQPLQPNELCYALAVELGSTDFNASNIPLMSTLVSCCQGLITVDKEASAVRLIHFTLQEYLSAHPDIFSKPHSVMAEICLTYLNSRQVKALQTAPYRHIPDTPFLNYCSVYWGVHAKRELSDCAKSLALELSQADHVYIPTTLLLGPLDNLDPQYRDPPRLLGGLHCASFFGIVEVVTALIEMERWDINEGDFFSTTPLAWAACNGHEDVVKILLGRAEVCPNDPDLFGRTPLSLAALNGREGVVKLLLGRKDVTPDTVDTDDETPLSTAARCGYVEVVKALLARKDVNPDRPAGCWFTPLCAAACGGCEEIVKILLGRTEVNPDKPDYYGITPLSHAASAGHEGVVKILLAREEVNPDKPDSVGRAALSWAASAGREGVVKILLAHKDVIPDKPDNDGRSPLSYAAGCGHTGVVNLLLARGDVNTGKPDNDGLTPLSHATRNYHKDVVALLQPGKAEPPLRCEVKKIPPLGNYHHSFPY